MIFDIFYLVLCLFGISLIIIRIMVGRGCWNGIGRSLGIAIGWIRDGILIFDSLPTNSCGYCQYSLHLVQKQFCLNRNLHLTFQIFTSFDLCQIYLSLLSSWYWYRWPLNFNFHLPPTKSYFTSDFCYFSMTNLIFQPIFSTNYDFISIWCVLFSLCFIIQSLVIFYCEIRA